MKYMGSKNRISKFILPIMLKEAEREDINIWVEPFVGGGNMIDKVPKSFKRIGIDVNIYTINALIAIRDFVDVLPTSLSEEGYKMLKYQEPTPINSWLSYVSAFGGGLGNGYARQEGSDETTFIELGRRNAQKQSPLLQGVELIHGNYKDFNDFKDCLIYCDPPYDGTTSYKTEKFNHLEFWEWCRKMSKHNLVFISEYNAPEDFISVWEGEIKTNFASQRKEATHNATEKLFVYKEILNNLYISTTIKPKQTIKIKSLF